jgi:hypothetical protein
MLFGWCPREPSAASSRVLQGMSAALRVTTQQHVEWWPDPALAVGAYALAPLDGETPNPLAPIQSEDGRFTLWMAGEAFAWDGAALGTGPAAHATFCHELLHRLSEERGDAIRGLDGEYQLALWDRQERTLSLFTDRFAALPLYWTCNAHGFAFAGGVRGVLMAPGVEATPDVQAIREAVTFGGFRLGTRTNIAAVKMASPAAVITVRDGRADARRYWSWTDAPIPVDVPASERLRQTQCAWQRAVTTRLAGSARPGLLLSGGLDSRAILAEAARHSQHVNAVTYGVPHSDDVRIAGRAARKARAAWEPFPLFAEGWMARRLAHVHATDGLINYVDLMHAEVLPQLRQRMDLYLSGYIGDLVSGSTYLKIDTADELLRAMPYYGGTLGMPLADATSIAEELISQTPGGGHFVSYEHKLPQAINRITAMARPWVRVRRPFVDYGFWSQAYRVPPALRANHQWHEHWLRTTYPALFACIPNQRTAVPPGSSPLRFQVTRAARYGVRRALTLARKTGLPVTVPERGFHPDWPAWRAPDVRDQITATILRPDSISADIFGRDRVAETLQAYFERDAAPTQVIGALFVFEHYHQTLPALLRQWRTEGNES